MDAPSQTIWPQLAIVAAVAASHMSMPNHWLPYSLVARAHSWSVRKALLLTALGAAGHVTATIAISLLISGIGAAFISHQQYRVLSSALLFVWGLYYLYSYFSKRKTTCCESSEKLPTLSKSQNVQKGDSSAVQRTAAISLVMLTTLSPCVGSMPVLVTLMAPPVAPSTVMLAAAVLFLTSMSVCCALVALSLLGASTMECTAVRKHERLILAAGLILLAALTFFVFTDDHEHHHHHGVQPLDQHNHHVHAHQ
ncbi:unnamed protein product [Agarophyton chilense]